MELHFLPCLPHLRDTRGPSDCLAKNGERSRAGNGLRQRRRPAAAGPSGPRGSAASRGAGVTPSRGAEVGLGAAALGSSPRPEPRAARCRGTARVLEDKRFALPWEALLWVCRKHHALALPCQGSCWV